MDCSLPGSSIHGIFQARVLEWGAIAFSSWCLQISTKLSLWQDCHSSLDLGPYSPMNREQYQGRTLTALPCECLDPSPQLGMRAVMGQSWVPRSPLQEERKSLPRWRDRKRNRLKTRPPWFPFSWASLRNPTQKLHTWQLTQPWTAGSNRSFH